MDRWDVFIFVVAGYVAVTSLARLMARRRNELVGHMRSQVAQQLGIPAEDTDSSAESATGSTTESSGQDAA